MRKFRRPLTPRVAEQRRTARAWRTHTKLFVVKCALIVNVWLAVNASLTGSPMPALARLDDDASQTQWGAAA